MLNIAIDGPGGSGKSTIARFLAEKLNILYLDTGAMYRAVALKAVKLGLKEFTEENVGAFIDDVNLVIAYESGAQKTILDGVDVSKEIRENSVSMLASKISALKCVREKMVEMQREVAKNNDCILDGRDIGSVVLPNASYKFYITASPIVRAERRQKELAMRGQNVELSQVLEEINARDYNDEHREFSPLKRADDAIFIDTTLLDVDNVIKKVLEYIK